MIKNDNMHIKTVAVTGCSGMIGSKLIKSIISNSNWSVVGLDRKESSIKNERIKSFVVDLADKEKVAQILQDNNVDRVIHLAALAHTKGEKDLSIDRYMHVNVDCAVNVFKAATQNNIPILFISTVDVLGFVKDVIDSATIPNPVSNYGKSKAIAEKKLKEISTQYDIFRFSPVYTRDIKRDIQKRYYLKEPNIAYKIGTGSKFEVLDVNKAIREMLKWMDSDTTQNTYIIKDDSLMDVNDIIRQERDLGRANVVLHFPRWCVILGYYLLKTLTGKSNSSYLIFKALWPFRSTDYSNYN